MFSGPCPTTSQEALHDEAIIEAQASAGGGFSFINGLRALADYGAGIANGIVSTVTFGQVHISEPYCGELGWTYGLGTGIGVAGTVVGGGAGADALGAGDAAYSRETFGTNNPLIGNSSINNGTPGILNQVGSALRLGWSVAPSDDGYAPVLRLANCSHVVVTVGRFTRELLGDCPVDVRPQPPTMRTSSCWSKVRLSASLLGTPRCAVTGTPSEAAPPDRQHGRHRPCHSGRQS